MSRPPRPGFLLSAGERKALEGLVTPEARLYHYESSFCSRFLWDAGPVPPDYPERSIYWTGGLGAGIDYGGEKTVFAGAPSLYGALGEPLRWIPRPAGAYALPQDTMSEHSASEFPFFYFGCFSQEIEDFCRIQADAWNCLSQTIEGMKQPVVVESVAGGEVGALDLGEDLASGIKKIYTISKTGMNAKVLDLGGHDHTQNLISTIGSIDAEILAMMGIKSIGTSKTSGITPEESEAIVQELRLLNDRELKKRRHFCDLVNASGVLGYEISVKLNPILEVPEDRGSAERQTTAENEKYD